MIFIPPGFTPQAKRHFARSYADTQRRHLQDQLRCRRIWTDWDLIGACIDLPGHDGQCRFIDYAGRVRPAAGNTPWELL